MKGKTECSVSFYIYILYILLIEHCTNLTGDGLFYVIRLGQVARILRIIHSHPNLRLETLNYCFYNASYPNHTIMQYTTMLLTHVGVKCSPTKRATL
jgi:hypothetical protein